MTVLRAALTAEGQPVGPLLSGTAGARQRVRTANRDRARVLVAASPVCADCGSTRGLTSDHTRPLARGGGNAGPQQVLCHRHNSSRGGAKNPEDVSGHEPRTTDHGGYVRHPPVRL